MGLLLAGTDKVIGTCGYTRWNREHHFAVLGYDLARLKVATPRDRSS